MTGAHRTAAVPDGCGRMTEYGTTFRLLRTAAGDAWPAYTRHPFVEGLGDGTLPRAAFLFYLRQDYVFLIHFARAWALAVTKADGIDDMRACAATVHALLVEEIGLHVETCAAAGIGRGELDATEEHPANIAYTRYVLDTGHRGDVLDLLAALAPCVLGYGEIGARLQTVATSDTYRDWIDTYAGADYQSTAHDVGGLIDRVVAARLGPDPAAHPRWPALTRIFTTATRLEADFWQMGWAAR